MPICLSLCAGQYHPSHQESSASANLCSSRSSSPPYPSTSSCSFSLFLSNCHLITLQEERETGRGVSAPSLIKNEDDAVVTDVLWGGWEHSYKEPCTLHSNIRCCDCRIVHLIAARTVLSLHPPKDVSPESRAPVLFTSDPTHIPGKGLSSQFFLTETLVELAK